jgi:SOS response regulatory protein OraA/RecX
MDPSSGELIAEATAAQRAWGRTPTVRSAARKAVEKIYAQLAYTGFDEEVYRQWLQRAHGPAP